MSQRKLALGLDFGTESVRALVVDCQTGEEAAQAVSSYRHGVISEKLPLTDEKLPPEFALQSARDYLDSMLEVTRQVLGKVSAREIIGVGVDFTACTMLPIRKDGTPLMLLPGFERKPHAWVKLWKHHAAQPEADRINELAAQRGEAFLKYYGGTISSEWMLPKCWEIAHHAPDVFEAADSFIDAGDWIVQQLTGKFSRNATAAGYKGLWNAEHGFPSQSFLTALDPALAGLRDKWLQDVVPPGKAVGGVSKSFAALSGLVEGTPVSAATIDAHSGVPGMGVYREGAFSIIMGTSSCHMVLSRELKLFEGYAGAVKDGILEGFYGYESGQPAVGDIFGWFVRDYCSGASFAEVSAQAAALKPGEHGLLALDWMNGNRSVLMNSNLSGMILGLTLRTKPHEIYRALIEATAFGSRKILESYREAGIPLHEIVVCGGLTQDPLILQAYADVCGLPVKVAASQQAVALGSAILASIAGGAHATLEEAITRMTRPFTHTYQPEASAKAVYDRLYALYLQAHDYFGRQNPAFMTQLKELRKES